MSDLILGKLRRLNADCKIASVYRDDRFWLWMVDYLKTCCTEIAKCDPEMLSDYELGVIVGSVGMLIQKKGE